MESNFNKQAFIGKTVESVDTSSINVVYIKFTDGTDIVLDTERVEHGLYSIVTSNPENYGDSFRQGTPSE
jgi:Cu/Ag efflux pump CusA